MSQAEKSLENKIKFGIKKILEKSKKNNIKDISVEEALKLLEFPELYENEEEWEKYYNSLIELAHLDNTSEQRLKEIVKKITGYYENYIENKIKSGMEMILEKSKKNNIKDVSAKEVLKLLGFPEPNKNDKKWKKYYKKFMILAHPDNTSDPILEEIVKKITEYYKVLRKNRFNVQSDNQRTNSSYSYETKSKYGTKSSYKNRKTQNYEPRQEELDEEYRKKYPGKGYKFYRPDSSTFSLIYLSPVVLLGKSREWYKYLFIDENNKKRLLFTEMSPDILFNLDSEGLLFLTNVFLEKERVKHIFKKVDKETVDILPMIGNGYAGSFDLKDRYNQIRGDTDHWIIVYDIRLEELENTLKTKGICFNREDGTQFHLRYLGEAKFEIKLADRVYKYSYYYHKEKIRDLYTEMSPGQIAKVIMNKQSLDFFVNKFLGIQNTFSIFNNEPFGNTDDYHCSGYGYAGQMILAEGNKFVVLGTRRPFECIRILYEEQNVDKNRGRN